MELRNYLNDAIYILLLVPILSCSQTESTADQQSQQPKKAPEPEPYTQEGEASYYARSLHGSKMANGKPYQPWALTAAHRKLPLGTIVEVTNIENDSTAIVEITDRGPYAGDRIIDLSRAAASNLDFIEHGKTEVALQVVKPAQGYTLSDSVGSKQVVSR